MFTLKDISMIPNGSQASEFVGIAELGEPQAKHVWEGSKLLNHATRQPAGRRQLNPATLQG